MRFQSPKCNCRVNEQAKHIKSFPFLSSLNMRTGELSVNTHQLRYLKKWLRYLLLNKKVTRYFTSYKGKVIWLRRSRYLCCFTPTLVTFTQQQNMVQSCIWVFNTVTFTQFIHYSYLRAWQPHSITELTTAFSENVLFEQNRTAKLVACHVIQCEREPLCCTNVYLPCVLMMHVLMIGYGNLQ